MDIAIVGGGAAGLATAIFAARLMPRHSVAVLDGADELGAKILLSGGGRCNITNRLVTAADYCGGSRNVIKQVLAAFPVDRTVAFFREIGVGLCEEDNGRLFPATKRASTVVEALVNEAARLRVRILAGQRVTRIRPESRGFRVGAGTNSMTASYVVLATGGQSFPKTGSDGAGYELAKELGHTLVPRTPALVPLTLERDFHASLSGVSHDVELIVQAADRKPARARGALLWTHFGVSGPAVLDISRYWHRARLEQRDVAVFANFVPGEGRAGIDTWLVDSAAARPRAQLDNALACLIPQRVADAVLDGPRNTSNDAHGAPGEGASAEAGGRTGPLAPSGAGQPRVCPRRSDGWRAYRCPKFIRAASAHGSAPGLCFAGEILDVGRPDGRIQLPMGVGKRVWVVASALARSSPPDG